MSRYIDADALIEAMGEEPYVWTDSAEEIAERNQWLTDMHIIESAPSIDIVFCKECKHWHEFIDAKGQGRCEADAHKPFRVSIGVSYADFFCSYGEREGE